MCCWGHPFDLVWLSKTFESFRTRLLTQHPKSWMVIMRHSYIMTLLFKCPLTHILLLSTNSDSGLFHFCSDSRHLCVISGFLLSNHCIIAKCHQQIVTDVCAMSWVSWWVGCIKWLTACFVKSRHKICQSFINICWLLVADYVSHSQCYK